MQKIINGGEEKDWGWDFGVGIGVGKLGVEAGLSGLLI